MNSDCVLLLQTVSSSSIPIFVSHKNFLFCCSILILVSICLHAFHRCSSFGVLDSYSYTSQQYGYIPQSPFSCLLAVERSLPTFHINTYWSNSLYRNFFHIILLIHKTERLSYGPRILFFRTYPLDIARIDFPAFAIWGTYPLRVDFSRG